MTSKGEVLKYVDFFVMQVIKKALIFCRYIWQAWFKYWIHAKRSNQVWKNFKEESWIFS
jgi:hypothetical protein